MVRGELAVIEGPDESPLESLEKYTYKDFGDVSQTVPVNGPAPGGPKVQTKYGVLKGLTLDKAHVFYGIPFADPPVGAQRWKPPAPLSPWKGVYDATYPRPACMQACIGPISDECPAQVSEDCLYLNVFVPLDTNFSFPLLKPLPVMVWIHGGDFIAGSASKPLYDGRFISNFTHTVVVSVEYRLGAFGFLVTGKNPKTSATGNYGIMDQQAALLWVQQNIAVFGGDPNRSVGLHLMVQSSQPLFRQAVFQSLPFSIPLKTRHDALKLGKHFSKLINCTVKDWACLRALSAKQVITAQVKAGGNNDTGCGRFLSAGSKVVNPFRFLEMFETWGPYIDGELIKEQAVTAFQKGHWQKDKPVLLGTTSEEGVIFVYGVFTKPVSALECSVYTTAIFKQHTLRILHKYMPLYKDTDRRAMLAQAQTPSERWLISESIDLPHHLCPLTFYTIKVSEGGIGTKLKFRCLVIGNGGISDYNEIVTDYVFLCPSRRSARAAAEAGGAVWMYVFDHAMADHRVWSGLTFCYGHSCHGAELPFLFDSASVANFTLTPPEHLLANRMLCYWGAFAHGGDPSSRVEQSPFCRQQRPPAWPRYSHPIGWLQMNLTVRSHAQAGSRDQICDFWDKLGIY
ncbi:hypothetical protein JZ751_016044 [Albula glossodonta]|uniref:Carboxylesterase type B domain-containing protein n=1 Tax=Albula glossodonta TaxID=121402 RepID=A0A8T2P1R3_9TELE|nr:hypothetical protein JZ751_016044 [Albula glossodonta]